MNQVLLDTVTVPELRKGDRMHDAVRAWQEKLPDVGSWLSVASVMEIRMGHLMVRTEIRCSRSGSQRGSKPL